MSVFPMVAVIERQFGNPHRKMLAMALADHASRDGRGIFAAKATLAAECEISPRSVQRYMIEFVEAGFLIVVDEGGHGPKSATRYDMNLAWLETLPKCRVERSDEAKKGDRESPLDENKGDSVSPLIDAKGDSHDTLGRLGVSQTCTEPVTPLTPQGEADRDGPPYDGDGPADRPEPASPFDQAFALWPGYLTEERAPAWGQWAQMALDERQRAKRYIPAFLDIWAKNQGRKRVYSFAKYLSEKPWNRAKAAPGGAGKPVILKAFTVEWLLRRFELLLAGPGVNDWRDPRHWRDLHDFDSKSRHGFAGAPAGWTPPRVDMEPVPVDSAVYLAWQDAFKGAGWPWLPDPGKLPVVHFPVGGPPAVGITSEFVALLSGPADQVAAREKSDA